MTTEESSLSEASESRAIAAPCIEWRCGAFDELTLRELYAVLRLRQRVFVVEQNCAYLDLDDSDQLASHLMAWTRDATPTLTAYARIFAPGIKYAESSIGRVITAPEARRTGIGKALMSEAIALTEQIAPESAIRIGAQIYLEKFYGGFGFRRASEPYDEDGIMHIEMLRPANVARIPAASHHG